MAGFNPHCIGGLHGSLLRQVVELLGMVTTGGLNQGEKIRSYETRTNFRYTAK
jgi:hypothetical protein